MNIAAEVLHTPLSKHPIMLWTLRIGVGLICLFVGVQGFRKASRLTSKQEIIAAVDKTDNFGRVLLKDNYIVSWNAGMRSLTGYRAAEVMGDTMKFLEPADEWEAGLVRRITHRDQRQWNAKGSCRLVRKDGTEIDLAVTIRDPDGPENFRELRFDNFDSLIPLDEMTTVEADKERLEAEGPVEQENKAEGEGK